jgi:membrane-bound serine protease (ClpP class)
MRHQPIRTGRASMLGQPAEVLDWAGGEGHVLAFGERWQARSSRTLSQGEHVEVQAIDGLVLTVGSPSDAARKGASP